MRKLGMKFGAVLWLLVGLLFSVQVGFAADNSLNDKAKAALEAGHVNEAADLLQQQVKVEPRDYEAWFLLGVSQARIQRYHPAIESFRRVIELRPDLAEPHNNLAVIYNELGDVKAAVHELEQSLKKHPDYTVAEENIADLYVKLALTYYKKALEKTDDRALQTRYARLLQVRDTSVVSDMPDVNVQMAAKSQGQQEGVAVVAEPVTVVSAAPENSVQIHPAAIPTEDHMDELSQVQRAIERWRMAWVLQNLPEYFSAYADDYSPPAKYDSLDAWKNYKKRVIGNKKFIQVTLRELQVNMAVAGRAEAKFKQAFRSDTYNGDDVKVLTLEKRGGDWKIVREDTL